MKIETKLRNEFLFEVRDSDTGELKQTVKSHNIILDGLWPHILGGYIDNYINTTNFWGIEIGSGTGTISPTRTGLFKSEGKYLILNKTRETTEEYTSLSGTVTIPHGDLVGVNLTEIGVISSNNFRLRPGLGSMLNPSVLISHSLLKDMNGNPISINKTDTDVITIYITMYMYFDKESLYNSGIMLNESLKNTVQGNSSWSFYLDYILSTAYRQSNVYAEYGAGYVNSDRFAMSYPSDITQARTLQTNAQNRSYKVITTFSPYTSGRGVSAFRFSNGFAILTGKNSSLPMYDIVKETLGTSDGEETIYRPYIDSFESIKVYLDGVETSDFEVLSKDINPLDYFISENNATIMVRPPTSVNPTSARYVYFGKGPGAANLKTFTQANARTIIFEFSDGTSETYNTITFTIPEGKYVTAIEFPTSSSVQFTSITQYKEYGIRLDEEPPAGTVITADYTTSRVPITKDNKFVLEVEWSFNEYSG